MKGEDTTRKKNAETVNNCFKIIKLTSSLQELPAHEDIRIVGTLGM